METKTCLGLCFCLILSVSLLGEEKQKQDSNQSCKAFVTTFYKWYLAISLEHNSIPASDRALKRRPYLFSSELVWRLREQSEVQDRAGSNLVSLDIDPFPGPDGSGDRFVVEKVTIKNDRCWAEIHSVRDGKEDATPDVTPELTLKERRWSFTNFYYPSPSNPEAWDLLGGLKTARESWKASGILNDKEH